MQPTHQDHRTEHNTTPLVNKLDTEAKRQGDAETAEQCWGTNERKKRRGNGGLRLGNWMLLASKGSQGKGGGGGGGNGNAKM